MITTSYYNCIMLTLEHMCLRSVLCVICVVMFYIYIVLLITAIITIIVYYLHLVQGCWGHRTETMGQQWSRQGKNVIKQRSTKKSDAKETKEKQEGNDDDSKENETKDNEELKIQIITNKEPIIERVDCDHKLIENDVKNSKFHRLCKVFTRMKSRQLTIPVKDWNGKVACVVIKNTVHWNSSGHVSKQG